MGNQTRVVNLRREDFDVYIGRAGKGQTGYFGNPFRLDPTKPRSEQSDVLDQYRAYFLNRVETDPEFRRRVLALEGKTLGCFCKPAGCHGDVIAEWVNAVASPTPEVGR